jgi:hypothetical protein
VSIANWRVGIYATQLSGPDNLSLVLAQKTEQLRSLRVVVRPQVMQQAYHNLNHDTAEQSSSQQNIDSYIYQASPLELNTKKYRDNSYCTWLNSLKFSAGVGVQGGSLRRAAR